MFQVTGKIINLFYSPKSEKYEASYKVQLLGDTPMASGQIKMEMVTLNIPKPVFDSLQGEIGTEQTFPVGLMVQNGFVKPFYPKNAAVS
jgi:hypothetical protein